MTNLFTEMNKEVAKHFTDKKEKQQAHDLSGFKTCNANGCQFIDLTSVDEDWSRYESFNRASDIERKQLYGDKAGSTKF